MIFKQYYLGCLAQASYLIASAGEAAVVDPRRDVDEYIDDARDAGAQIRYVIETHLHADFVSGHCELAERTGATIIFGPNAGASFDYREVADGQQLRIGDVTLQILTTPGHTPESISILARDEAHPDAPPKLLTGDTLFLGDVGRPDLAGARGFTAAEMAGMLYDSLHGKILPLDDATEVYPAHGAGSACGRNISKERFSTLGIQRRTNYALQPMTREAFIALLTTDLPAAPRYFPHDAEMNRRGARAVGEIASVALAPAEVKKRVEGGAEVLDVRDSSAFAWGHVAGAINIGLQGEYATWCGTLLQPNREYIICAASPEEAREATVRLARVGLENAVGYIDGGVEAWAEAGFEVMQLRQWSVQDLERELAYGTRLNVIDVRRPPEFRNGHVPGAQNVPLQEFESALAKVDLKEPTAVICAGGYRSSAASSLLQKRGARTLYNVVGGTAAWTAAGLPVEA